LKDQTPDVGDVFPFRAASVDIGSNAIRFLAVEFHHASSYDVLEQIRTPVRLGHEAFQKGRLAEPEMAAAIEALTQYARLMRSLDITHYRAVATSAVRESRNRGELIRRVKEASGLTIEPITGAEEARLVHQAVRSRIEFGADRWLLVDLGGGSVEVSLVDDDRIHWSASHEIGSVRLLEELTVADDDPARFRKRLDEYLAQLRIPKRGQKPKGFVATGGNIDALAKIAGDVDEMGVCTLELSELRAIMKRLGKLSYTERIEQMGLREDRADVILPAAAVYERLCVLAGFDQILVPHVGVKEGVVLDLADDLAQHGQHDKRQDQVVYQGALSLGRRYRFEQPHAKHVTAIAVSLFDQLEELHGLGAADNRILMAAGLLHDIGTFVSYRKHHKHSLYLISQADLPGFTPNEIQMVANVARYHRKGHPSDQHEEFVALSEEDQERVTVLSSLLRLADGFDREHVQNVTHVAVEHDEDTVMLRASGKGDMLLERWAVEKKGGLFEEMFDCRLKVRCETMDV